MYHERGIIFGALDFEASTIARRLGFNNDGITPSFAVPKEIGEGEIYHAKPWGGKNIVVANVVLKEENEPSFFLRTFEGPDPTEMDSGNPDRGKQQYKEFIENVMKVVDPVYKVTPVILKEKLEELSRE